MELQRPKAQQLYRKTAILLVIALFVKLFSLNAQLVERYYSNGIYKVLSKISRALFGWIPFSFGDILYVLAGVWLLVKLIKLGKALFLKPAAVFAKENLQYYFFRCLNFILCIYLVFNIGWGLNYNRLGITHQLGLKVTDYSTAELIDINYQLLEKVNSCKSYLDSTKKIEISNKVLFEVTANAYYEAEKKYPFLEYEFTSLKPSLFGKLGSYSAFLGYYNPFTAEAQVNTTVPKFGQPFTACHEVAHQLGYAKEMEANFVGYLVASNSKDSFVRYAVYADLFKYANRALFFADTAGSNEIRKQLLPSVKKDFLEERLFYQKHSTVLDPALRNFYDAFLKSNGQELGIESYDEVTAFLIAFYKKYNYI
jgi:Protein of unknown function (DUF3810)